jgi:hypothetical protein
MERFRERSRHLGDHDVTGLTKIAETKIAEQYWSRAISRLIVLMGRLQ